MRGILGSVLLLIIIQWSIVADSQEDGLNILKLFPQKATFDSILRSGLNKKSNRISREKQKNMSKRRYLNSNKIPSAHEEDIILSKFGSAYLTNISIGNPPQNFTVLLETSNSIFIVPSEDCESNACRNHRRFDSKLSTTYEQDGTPFKFQREISGFVSKDSVCIFDICAEKQAFGEATFEFFMYDNDPWDGVLGIGFIPEKGLTIPPILSTLVKEGHVSQPVFGMWFGESDGELSLGKVDNRRFTGAISWYPVISFASGAAWAFNINKIVVDSISVSTGVVGTIENNLKDIWGPDEETDKIFAVIGNFKRQPDYWTRYYNNNCSEEFVNSLPDISFVLGGKPFSLTGREYTLTDYENLRCESRILGVKESAGFWRLGAPFTHKFYTVFDFAKTLIGFAKSKNSDA